MTILTGNMESSLLVLIRLKRHQYWHTCTCMYPTCTAHDFWHCVSGL